MWRQIGPHRGAQRSSSTTSLFPSFTSLTRPRPTTVQALHSSTMVYKGKSTTRSWATLPPEIVRLITTHYLLCISATAVLPAVWQQRENWPGRMAFTIVRDAEALQQLMRVSPAWAAASTYPFLCYSLFALWFLLLGGCGHSRSWLAGDCDGDGQAHRRGSGPAGQSRCGLSCSTRIMVARICAT